jgi:membrane associated rhomboid family serine protease
MIGLPPVTQWLLIANVAVYVMEGSGMLNAAAFALWPPGGFLSADGGRFEVWQLVTYSFLHGSLAHIFFNMLALYMFGGEIERLFGSRFYTLYYFASVISAAICHLVVTAAMGSPPAPMVGASGGIYGLLLAFAIYFPHRRVLLLFPPIPLPARVFVFGFAALELFLGITQTAAGVAHFAHLGGMLGGWLMIQYRRNGFPFRM